MLTNRGRHHQLLRLAVAKERRLLSSRVMRLWILACWAGGCERECQIVCVCVCVCVRVSLSVSLSLSRFLTVSWFLSLYLSLFSSVCLSRLISYKHTYTWYCNDDLSALVQLHCSVLQCVAVCCSMSQCVTVCCSMSQCVAVCHSVLQYVAMCCSVLQCVTACHSSAITRALEQSQQSSCAISVTWRIFTSDTTPLFVWHDSSWVQHDSKIPWIGIWQVSFTCETSLMHSSGVIHLHVCHMACLCALHLSLIRMV